MRFSLLITLLVFCFSLNAQQYSRVKINLDQQHTIKQLALLGLEVDHGRLQPERYFISEFSEDEISKIQAAGFSTEVLIEDLQAHLRQLNEAVTAPSVERSAGCGGFEANEWVTPANYETGSMGGYFTYQEMLDNLDAMAAQYPNLFKARQPITTAYQTHEGRPVFWVKVSDNPNTDETNEPEVLYTALHHAREPNSLSSMIFYLWYLLENYDSDPEVKYLVDNVEMYFVPCINPDGYIYNETTNPDGGGFWRKNRRNNGNGTFGVDLNRNYSHEWGFDNEGSSPNPSDETYRGPGPFSEPETQMIRDFCLERDFQVALNYHTFGNLLIFPWGFTDSATPDHPTFQAFGSLMTRENNYLAGFGSQTVGYTVNGNSDDWMYGEQSAKSKIFSLTPEVGPGNFGFWPPQSAIDALNKTVMYQNLVAARVVLNYGEATPSPDQFISDLQGEIAFDLKKYGLANGPLKVSLTPVSSNILSTGNPVNYGIFHLEEVTGAISYTLDPSIGEGEIAAFELSVDNGEFAWTQIVERIFTQNNMQVFLDPGDDLSQWSPFTEWAVTDEQFYTAPTSITDSPDSEYIPNNFSEIAMAEPLTIENATAAFLNFRAKWDIEEDYDYVQVMLSVNGGAYFPLCGKYTENGTPDQDDGQPLYDGLQPEWVLEEIDLTEYLNPDTPVDFRIIFRLVSDGFVEADGFYFDDLSLTVVEESTTSTLDLNAADFTITTRPNPASNYVIIDLKGETVHWPEMNLEVFNQLGQRVASRQVQGSIIRLDTEGWQPGIYQFRLQAGGKWLPAGRFLISKR